MDLLTANDRPGTYPPSYYAASAPLPAPAAALDTDVTADVCVVGAGFTGLSCALALRRHGYDVVVVEAHRAGWGASGRNGGQVGSGQRVDQNQLERLVGEGHARELWDIGEASKRLVRGLIDTHGIDAEVTPGILHADHRRRFLDHSRQWVDLLNTKYDYDAIRFVDGTEMREMVASPGYHGGALDMDAFHLHPLKYALGLAGAAKDAGARFFENTRVLRVDPGTPNRVVTAQGTVSAKIVVLAGNGYLGRLDDRLATRIMPINNFIVATEPLGPERARALIRDDMAVGDSRFVINYFRLSRDHRLLFGGGETYSYRYPKDVAALVRRPLEQVFPQLKGVRIDHAWGGTLAITRTRLPIIQRLSPTLYAGCGYSGHGVGMATLAGHALADGIHGAEGGHLDVFQRLSTVPFPGGQTLRKPLMVLAMIYFALRDRL